MVPENEATSRRFDLISVDEMRGGIVLPQKIAAVSRNASRNISRQ